jgi:hypothetical protein
MVIIAGAWADPGFKARLLTNPTEAVKECSIDLPANLDLKVYTNSESELHIAFPARPANLELPSSSGHPSEDDGGCWLPCRVNNSW